MLLYNSFESLIATLLEFPHNLIILIRFIFISGLLLHYVQNGSTLSFWVNSKNCLIRKAHRLTNRLRGLIPTPVLSRGGGGGDKIFKRNGRPLVPMQSFLLLSLYCWLTRLQLSETVLILFLVWSFCYNISEQIGVKFYNNMSMYFSCKKRPKMDCHKKA